MSVNDILIDRDVQCVAVLGCKTDTIAQPTSYSTQKHVFISVWMHGEFWHTKQAVRQSY